MTRICVALLLAAAPGALAQSAQPAQPPQSAQPPPEQPAQSAGGYSAEPSLPSPDYSATVAGSRPSPAFTQDRDFTGTRFWLIDPGRYEIETWFSQKRFSSTSKESLAQVEIEMGIAPHLQLDIYQNFTTDGELRVEGEQIELRYALGLNYNEIPLNPVLYLEWHPRNGLQDRAEFRLLLGGDVGKLVWASNLYYEMNVDGYDSPNAQGKDIEAGVSGAASYGFGDLLRLGAEVQAGADDHGLPTLAPVLLVGPNALLKLPALGLKLTATVFFGVMSNDPRIYPLLIGGWQF